MVDGKTEGKEYSLYVYIDPISFYLHNAQVTLRWFQGELTVVNCMLQTLSSITVKNTILFSSSILYNRRSNVWQSVIADLQP
jgi:hypothetical protein